MARGSKPGERRGGRKTGTPNKTTADVKAAILEAFERAGGTDYLATIAVDDPRTFCTLLGKVLPTQITGDLNIHGLSDVVQRAAELRAERAGSRDDSGASG